MVTRTLSMQISENLSTLSSRISFALSARTPPKTSHCDLLAVSKTKPVSDLLDAYTAGQRHVGENYVDEFVDMVPQLPFPDIHWHFIGHIQTNKIRKLLSVVQPGL